MANLRFRLTIIAVGLVLIALALGWFAPMLIGMMPDQATTVNMLAATFVFVGLCGVAFYTLMERSLNPVMRLIDTFTRMRAGELNPRLPIEGPEEMRRMARGFNDMVEDLETQIRDIEIEKQSAERDRQQFESQLTQSQRFQWAVNAAPVGVVVANADLNVVYQNPASESEFLQLDLGDRTDKPIVGASIVSLYPQGAEVSPILSDPDRLPYETEVVVGPHTLHFLANAIFDEDEEFAGVVLIWEESVEPETVEEDVTFPDDFVEALEEEETFDFNEALEPVDPDAGIDEDVLAEVEELEAAESSFEMIEDESGEVEAAPIQNGVPVVHEDRPEVRRSAHLVQRSVAVLSDRLEGVTNTVDALCTEGDGLVRTIEEMKSQAEGARHLAAERATPLNDLVHDRDRIHRRRESIAELARSMRKGLADAGDLEQAMDRLRGSIEHLVVSARVELGRVDAETGGMNVVVDAIGDLGEEARRLGESTHSCIRSLNDSADEVIDLVREESDPIGLEERLGVRAQETLEKMHEDRHDISQHNDLLTEMARGQAEIAQHILKQVRELAELVTLTTRVAEEQVEIVEGVASDE